MPIDLAGGEILDTPLADALAERYLAYALSTIMSRSLPDVRDGLKPVHRRLLWAMHQLRLDPSSGFKKCARVVGDVIGKFHPHGDAAVYEALVRLAQGFAQRYPLIEGQGNFGNIDGDNAAAMRYTEARLTEVAQALLAGIEEDAVDFRATYDGEEKEPVVLPAAFPNLLANGAQGIAVGMATSIPPHNTGELCAAALLLIEKPDATTEELMRHVKGPDFPTGGVLVEPREAMLAAYETGRGSFRLRAKWHVEEGKYGTWRVVVTEIPWLVQKARLVEQIAQAMEERKLPLLGDLRDESTDAVRLVLEPRSKTVDPGVLMESLFRATALESRISLNLNVLDATRTPRVMSLKEALRAWLDHRHAVLERVSRHRLAAAERRIEVLEGQLAVYLNLDEVIRIIRTEEEPKPVLMARFSLSEVQAEAILNMRLRSLRRLEEMEIRKEHKALAAERKRLRSLLGSEKERWAAIAAEIEAMRTRFASGPLGARRTRLAEAPPPAAEAVEAALAVREPVTVVCSEKGWIRALKGHLADIAGLKFKEGDRLFAAVPAWTTDRLLAFGTNGRAYTIAVDRLPGGRGDGVPIRLLIDLPNDATLIGLRVQPAEGRFLVAGAKGRGFIVPAEELVAATKAGKQVLALDLGEEAVVCAPVPEGADHVATIGENRKLLIFPLDELPVLAKGRGVALQKFKQGGLADAKPFALGEGLAVRLGESRVSVRTKGELAEWLGHRAGAGRLPWRGFPSSGRFG
ncbi:DNA topoisomerase IV subunit A [Elioraea tepida]|jgi:topoisomerase-4 subunit A|uniref:DNA topoisomerase 4 subunit A n=1 Tax=Elioraea tepida TaxID=2843330 RepID=A0A975YJT1_9PROT|nr:DNA topoisomerase IV subunit A [Elioraea tepida]QXM25105.1 DNA topoisomerase IV subunit A [Elioraea tepida]